MTDLYLGIDVGTSGVRTAVLDPLGLVVSSTKVPFATKQSEISDAGDWWHAVESCLTEQRSALGALGRSMTDISSIAVDGTSGSMVLVDRRLKPITPALMYNSAGFDAEEALIDGHAEEGSITRGGNSALARLLRLQSEDHDRRAHHVCMQADFILARLRGAGGVSDANNVLKLGYDPQTGVWPDWFQAAGVRIDILPQVYEPGQGVGTVSPVIAQRFGLAPDTCLHAGTTDSIAAFIASGADQVGDAVTSLGTTLAVKLLSNRRIDDASRGLYSHKLGQAWLVGGASNTGGGVLMDHFTLQELAEFGAQIDPSKSSGLHYYPLSRPGERFPINDPSLAPQLTPRPASRIAFLQGLLEGIARIEAECYAAMKSLGAPAPKRILTAGGGANNVAWTEIRNRMLPCSVGPAPQSEASVGAAMLGLPTAWSTATVPTTDNRL